MILSFGYNNLSIIQPEKGEIQVFFNFIHFSHFLSLLSLISALTTSIMKKGFETEAFKAEEGGDILASLGQTLRRHRRLTTTQSNGESDKEVWLNIIVPVH